MNKTIESAAAVEIKERKGFTEAVEWLEAVVFSLVLVVLLFTFVFRIVGVDGNSMLPTLTSGDRVIISSFDYKPKNGDIVVVTQPNSLNKPLIKRVIAREYQTIDINFDTGAVTVDGQQLEEDYILELITRKGQGDVTFPLTVPEGKVFVMGDNRNDSLDSRFQMVGLIDERYLLGKAVFRIFPFNTFGKVS